MSLGSSFLYAGVISESFKESGNLLFLMAVLIELVRLKKQFSLFFSTFTGISQAVALSKGKLFTTFLTAALEQNSGKRIFCLAWICVDFNNTRMIGKTFNYTLHLVIGDRICNWFKVWVKIICYLHVFSQNFTVFIQGNFWVTKWMLVRNLGFAALPKKALNLGKGLNYQNVPA